jgi:hypothetical protein
MKISEDKDDSSKTALPFVDFISVIAASPMWKWVVEGDKNGTRCLGV